MAVDLPSSFGWVVLASLAYCFLNFWMTIYNVPYPTMYAVESENKEAKKFNCVQRGHQNCLEMMPMFFLLLILGGLQHPVVSSFLGVFYCLARYAYFTGYSTGEPQNRLTYGKYHFFALLGLMVCTLSLGFGLLFKAPQ